MARPDDDDDDAVIVVTPLENTLLAMGGKLRCGWRVIPLDVVLFVWLYVVALEWRSGDAAAAAAAAEASTPGTAFVTPEIDVERQRSWARAGFRFISTVSCRRSTFTTGKECQRLAKVDLNATAVYLAAPSSTGGKVNAVYPESSVQSDAEYHDGVLAVDPYPEANFGHLVIVFYIDLNLERTECEQEGGAWLEGM